MTGWRSRRARARGASESGIAAMGVIVAVAIGLVALLFWGIVPLLSGTEQSGRTQTSADAAALAGAKDLRELVLDELDSVLTLGGSSFDGLLGPARGHGAAQAFASANDAELVEYGYEPFQDRFTARTRLLESAPNGDRAESLSTASLGVELGRCALNRKSEIIGFEPVPEPEPEPTPTPTPGEPSPTPTPTPTPTPPPPPVPIFGFTYQFECEERPDSPHFATGWSLDPRDLRGATHDWLESTLEPSLVR